MLRRAIALLLIALSITALPTPASAAGRWDPEDVTGPFDLRWVGADYTSSTSLAFIVSFYEGFEVSELPWRPRGGPARGIAAGVEVFIEIDSPNIWAGFSGYLLRRAEGRVAFIYGDLGSACGADFPNSCGRGTVKRIGPNVVRVVIGNLFPEQVEGFTLRARTHWTTPDNTTDIDYFQNLVVPSSSTSVPAA